MGGWSGLERSGLPRKGGLDGCGVGDHRGACDGWKGLMIESFLT